MLILALDTSGETCSVSVSNGTECLTQYTFRHARHLTERLPGIVQFALHDAGKTLDDIEAFAVGLGPGSFTGVRVGVTMAKVWAMSLEKPVVGVSSLDALAEPLAFTDLPLICVAPTRRTESIAAFYAGQTTIPLAQPKVIANDAIVSHAYEIIGTANKLLIVGEIAPIIAQATVNSIPSLSLVTTAPTASAIARLAYKRLQANDSDDTDSLVPLYITPPPTG